MNDDIGHDAFAEPVKKKRKFRLHRKRRVVPFRVLLPNIITLTGLIAGLTAIRFSIEDRLEQAILLIILAAFLDAVDGRVARALKGSSRFGAELDSLADFVNFAVAPAILLYQWGLSDIRGLGWIAALGFAVSGALRLARFNASNFEPEIDQPIWQKGFFEGVPAPAGAICVMIPLYMHQLGISSFKDTPLLIVIHMAVMAALMVSQLPTFSGKSWLKQINSDYVLPFMFVGALLVGFLLTYPAATLLTGALLYLSTLPFGYLSYHKQKRIHTSENEDAG